MGKPPCCRYSWMRLANDAFGDGDELARVVFAAQDRGDALVPAGIVTDPPVAATLPSARRTPPASSPNTRMSPLRIPPRAPDTEPWPPVGDLERDLGAKQVIDQARAVRPDLGQQQPRVVPVHGVVHLRSGHGRGRVRRRTVAAAGRGSARSA